MPPPSRPDRKAQTLREQGVLHPHPDKVIDPRFRPGAFFDPRDLLQVKYEMLRRVQVDRQTVSDAASAFGLSRPAFYEAQAAFRAEGLPGLLPRKRGPHGPHKLTPEVLAFLKEELRREPPPKAPKLAQSLEERFSLSLHPRTIARASARLKKKRL